MTKTMESGGEECDWLGPTWMRKMARENFFADFLKELVHAGEEISYESGGSPARCSTTAP
jgi:hypothetical protein